MLRITARTFGLSTVSTMLVATSACGSSGTTDFDTLEIGWRFDYADYTSGQPSNIRGCDNAENTDITAVRVTASDPNGVLSGFDIPFSCAEGDGTSTSVLDLDEGRYEVTAEATVSQNQVLYRLDTTELELTSAEPVTLTLRAAVGELRFGPNVEGVSDCSAEVGTISVELFEVVDGEPAPNSTTVRFIDEPCDGADFAELEIFDIPVQPISTGSGFEQTRYAIRAEVDDPGDARIGCAALERDVPPGQAPGAGTLSFSLGACP